MIRHIEDIRYLMRFLAEKNLWKVGANLRFVNLRGGY